MILGQTVFEIFEELISYRTNEQDEAYPNTAKRLKTLQSVTNSTYICLQTFARRVFYRLTVTLMAISVCVPQIDPLLSSWGKQLRCCSIICKGLSGVTGFHACHFSAGLNQHCDDGAYLLSVAVFTFAAAAGRRQ